MIDKRPAVIVRCRGVADVQAAVDFAREGDLVLGVRGGGHNVAGLALADEGLVIDLSHMKDVRVDPDRRSVRAEGGVRLGELDRATQAVGLATPMGVVSETGIAGLTLSGGIGWLRRKYGMSCDNLVSAEVVAADGRSLTASEEENSDLFWGIRGGGGNFGVVTAFDYRLYPVGPEVMFVLVFYPGDRAAEVLRAYERYMAEAPDEVSPLAVLGRIPRADMFPAESHGKSYAAIAAMYSAEVEAGERVLRPLRELAEPIVDLSAPMPYIEAQKLFDEDYPNAGGTTGSRSTWAGSATR